MSASRHRNRVGDCPAFHAEGGTNLATLRGTLLQARTRAVNAMFERAVDRGEINPATLTPLVRRVAFDRYLHHLMITLKPVPEETIAAILDEVFLPLVTIR